MHKRILVTGASGLVGRVLCRRLLERGYEVQTLGRGASSDFHWDLASGAMDVGALDGVDAVVHLAGETVAQRWTQAAKARIMESRSISTSLLSTAILKQSKRPDLICASGSNFYGYNRGGGLDESTCSGEGFLAEVCRAWEGAAQPLINAGVRTVFVRTGLVLSGEGGALAKMLVPFKAGIGGRVGAGTQLMSWLTVSDLAEIYIYLIEQSSMIGPVNAAVPRSVSNAEFTSMLGRVLGRPTLFPVPEFMVKVLFGEMGEETVLADVGILPARLMESGFVWRSPDLEMALCECLSSE